MGRRSGPRAIVPDLDRASVPTSRIESSRLPATAVTAEADPKDPGMRAGPGDPGAGRPGPGRQSRARSRCASRSAIPEARSERSRRRIRSPSPSAASTIEAGGPDDRQPLREVFDVAQLAQALAEQRLAERDVGDDAGERVEQQNAARPGDLAAGRRGVGQRLAAGTSPARRVRAGRGRQAATRCAGRSRAASARRRRRDGETLECSIVLIV